MNWGAFWIAMLPAVTDLLRELYTRTAGDTGAAKAELRRIRDQWAGLEAGEAAVDARIDAVRKRGRS